MTPRMGRGVKGATLLAGCLVGQVEAGFGGFAVHPFCLGREDGQKGGVGGESVEAGPGFGGGASPGGVDDPDRDVLVLVLKSFLQVACEEVGHGGEGLRSLGGAESPAGSGFDVFERVIGGVFFDAEESDVRVVGGGDLFGRVLDLGVRVEACERHLHVGLAGGEPEIAEENIV
jgi:hypothetical protein